MVKRGDIVYMNTNLDELANFGAYTNTHRFTGPGIICSIKNMNQERTDRIPNYFNADVIEVYWLESGSRMLFPVGTKLLKMAHEL